MKNDDLTGYWKITEMNVWGQAYMDLVVPGFVEFEMEEDDHLNDLSGGGRGIRTPGTVPRTAVFKTAAFDRSAIPPTRANCCRTRT